MRKGQLGVLNVGAGDTKLVFDKDNPMERARSARIVADMIKRGYVLFIATGEIDGKQTYRRVLQFDESACEYIIADFAPETVSLAPETEREEQAVDEPSRETPGSERSAPKPKAKRGRPPNLRVDAGDAHGVAVARSAGG